MVLGSIQFDLCIASQSFTIDRNDKLRAKMFLQKVATRVVAKKIVCWLRKSFRRLTTEGAYASCIDAVDAYGGGGWWYGYHLKALFWASSQTFLGMSSLIRSRYSTNSSWSKWVSCTVVGRTVGEFFRKNSTSSREAFSEESPQI